MIKFPYYQEGCDELHIWQETIQSLQALAEVLEDRRAMASQEMHKLKYKSYQGPEPILDITVRVQPESEPPFEAKMKAGLARTFLLKPGVKVQVKYEPGKKQQFNLDDNDQVILKRNLQLIKKV